MTAINVPPAKDRALKPNNLPPGGPPTSSNDGHHPFGTQEANAVVAGPNVPPPMAGAKPRWLPAGGPQNSSSGSQATHAKTQRLFAAAAGPDLPADHGPHETQPPSVGGDQTPGENQPEHENQGFVVLSGPHSPEPGHADSAKTHARAAGLGPQAPEEESLHSDEHPYGLIPPSPARSRPLKPTVSAPGSGPYLWSPMLGIAAEVLDDLEHVQFANENRLRQLTRTGVDKDGLHRGFGLTEDHPDVKRLAELVDRLKGDTEQATKNLEYIMRHHPLGPWCKATTGVGEKQLARLLAAVGDPYWNSKHNRPRTVSELWAYCGYHVVLRTGDQRGSAKTQNPAVAGPAPQLHPGDHSASETQGATVAGVAPRRKHGEKGNWNDTARMRARLIAESCMKHRTSPYRAVYEETRKKYADAIHIHPCAQCGTKGKPAAPGTELRDGHKNARALRKVAKEVLKDLFAEAERLHQAAGSGQAVNETHMAIAAACLNGAGDGQLPGAKTQNHSAVPGSPT